MKEKHPPLRNFSEKLDSQNLQNNPRISNTSLDQILKSFKDD